MADFYNKQRYGIRASGSRATGGERLAQDMSRLGSSIQQFGSSAAKAIKRFDVSQSKEVGQTLSEEVSVELSQIIEGTDRAIYENNGDINYEETIEGIDYYIAEKTADAKEKFDEGTVAHEQFMERLPSQVEFAEKYKTKLYQMKFDRDRAIVRQNAQKAIEESNTALVNKKFVEDQKNKVVETYNIKDRPAATERFSSDITSHLIATFKNKSINVDEIMTEGRVDNEKINTLVQENFGGIVEIDENGNYKGANDWVREEDVLKVKSLLSSIKQSNQKEIEVGFQEQDYGLGTDDESLSNVINKREEYAQSYSPYEPHLNKSDKDKLNEFREETEVLRYIKGLDQDALLQTVNNGYIEADDGRAKELSRKAEKQAEMLADSRYGNTHFQDGNILYGESSITEQGIAAMKDAKVFKEKTGGYPKALINNINDFQNQKVEAESKEEFLTKLTSMQAAIEEGIVKPESIYMTKKDISKAVNMISKQDEFDAEIIKNQISRAQYNNAIGRGSISEADISGANLRLVERNKEKINDEISNLAVFFEDQELNDYELGTLAHLATIEGRKLKDAEDVAKFAKGRFYIHDKLGFGDRQYVMKPGKQGEITDKEMEDFLLYVSNEVDDDIFEENIGTIPRLLNEKVELLDFDYTVSEDSGVVIDSIYIEKDNGEQINLPLSDMVGSDIITKDVIEEVSEREDFADILESDKESPVGSNYGFGGGL